MSIPTVGQRFEIDGAEFEIAHIAPERLRYASVKGGQQFNMAIDKVQSLISKGSIKLIGRTTTEETQPDELSGKDIKTMDYRLEYARHISLSTRHTGSKRIVEPLIEEVAKATGDKKPPSFSSCVRWVNRYKGSNKNPTSLVPRYNNCGNKTLRFSSEIENLMSKHLSEEYLINQRLTATSVHANIIGDIYERDLDHLDIPSERTINRRVNEIDPYLRSKARYGIYQANRKYKAAGKSYLATRILEAVEADGNQLDVLIVDSDTGEVMGRPYGTCLIDKYSRCILAFKITMAPFSAATLLSTLSTALSEEKKGMSGLFETLIVDNGSDYISNSLRNFCQNTGIRIEYGSPRDPNSKPHVERFFGTMNKQLIHLLAGTTRSNPVDRGEYNSKEYAILTLDKVQEYFDDWLEIYHQGIHQGHGRAPEKVWEESLKDNPVVTFPKAHLETIAREIEYRDIVKGRVKVHGLQWYAPTLASLEQELKNTKKPKQVEVYIDSLNLSRVYVRNPHGKKGMIPCDAVKSEYTKGLSLYEHRQIVDEIKEQGKKDLASYGEHELQIKRWKLWQKINAEGKEFAKAKIARLKENKQQQEKNIELVKQEKKKRAENAAKPKTKSNKAKGDKKLSSSNAKANEQTKSKKSSPPKSKPKYIKIKRLGNDN